MINLRNLFKRQYRIIKDNFAGYEVNHRSIFTLFIWIETAKIGLWTNTFSSVEQAKEWINQGCPKTNKSKTVWRSY